MECPHSCRKQHEWNAFMYVSSPKAVSYEQVRASHIVGTPVWNCISQTKHLE
jgi:hypothetical protein